MNTVLCHGIFGFKTALGVEDFNGVRQHLIDRFPAVRILVTKVAPLSAALAHAGIEVGGLRSITTEGTRDFNARFRDNDSTKKFSVAGVGRGRTVLGIHLDTCVALRLPYRFLKDNTGEDNDGLV